MKIKQKPKKDNSERWLLTYADLITLLMILFIMLFAMSSVDETKYNQMKEAFNNTMGQGASIFSGGTNSGVFPKEGSDSPVVIGIDTGESGSGNEIEYISAPPKATSAPEEVTPTPGHASTSQNSGEMAGRLVTEQDMKNFEKYVTKMLQDLDMGASAGTSMMERGLTITFKNDVFFDSGKDILKEDMKKSLDKMAQLLNRVDNMVVIEGHTDNIPISSNIKFQSNWQLSAARAANVAQYLVEEGKVDGSRISASGYAEYKPVTTNATAQGRSQNRRVDIIILYDNVE